MATKGFLNSTIEKLSPEQANKELEKLYKEVQLHNKLYFQEDSPKIPDSEYDALVERIRQIEAKALRKLRHPTRSSHLKGFLDE